MSISTRSSPSSLGAPQKVQESSLTLTLSRRERGKNSAGLFAALSSVREIQGRLTSILSPPHKTLYSPARVLRLFF